MLIHGYASDMLLKGTMCPIPKGNVKNVSDKYRAVTLSSSITKLFDLVVIEKQRKYLASDSLQFGFKPGSSTSLCTLILKETVSKFLSEGSNVYCVMLDASKAFDKVQYSKLFKLLIETGMNISYIRILFYMYLNQKLRTKWNGYYSNFFHVNNGVKQGGVLSPLLFCIYMDKLLVLLRSSQKGCYMGPHFFGALSYADDLVLLSPSKKGLQDMLAICCDYAEDYRMTFNGSKSQLIVFRKKTTAQKECINIAGEWIEEQSSAVHLGHTIHSNVQKCDLENVKKAFYRQFNIFVRRFGHIPSYLQSRLFITYCSSLYGLVLIPIQMTDKIQVILRKALRLIWKFPYRSHSILLRSLPGTPCDKHLVLSRFVKFTLLVMKKELGAFKYAIKCYMNNGQSLLRQNAIKCSELLTVELDGFKTLTNGQIFTNLRTDCQASCKNEESLALGTCLHELALVRDGQAECGLFKNEILELIDSICLS